MFTKNQAPAYTEDGYIIISPHDNPHGIVNILLKTKYDEEFCFARGIHPDFIARLMAAGFLVMSCWAPCGDDFLLLVMPKHHLIRSVLQFKELHVEKSAHRFLPRYELRFNTDFETIIDKCVETHGDDWLTGPLVAVIKRIRRKGTYDVQPVSFGVYREGVLKAGEFGIIAGKVYTSYSGYHEERNAGKVQMILTARYLEEKGFAFWDFGMPLDYKTQMGARNISLKQFIKLFRKATGYRKRWLRAVLAPFPFFSKKGRLKGTIRTDHEEQT
jgi:Leu/Phe-tRNA-protein transferase